MSVAGDRARCGENVVAVARAMSELAARWSELLIADVPQSQKLTAAAQTSGSLLRQPATEDQIQAAERRLGRLLPASYREFLLVSNGAYGDDYGPTLAPDDGGPQDPPPESDVVGVGLLAVEDLRWLRDAQPVFAEMLSELRGSGEDRPAVVDGEDAPGWAPFAEGLVIATNKAPGTTVLVPFEGLDEWQLWNVHKESTVAYRSFGSFMEYKVIEREPVTTLEDVENLVVLATAGDRHATRRLARVVAPEAVPLLVSAADYPRLGFWAVLGLGRIGTPDAVAALISLGVRSTAALVLAGSDQARDTLAAWGQLDALFELGDPRALDLATERIAKPDLDSGARWELTSALKIITYSGDRRHVPLLLPLLQADTHVQFLAAIALVHLGASAGEERLTLLAQDPGFHLQAAAAWYLTRLQRIREAG
jgi:hypothetical protein